MSKENCLKLLKEGDFRNNKEFSLMVSESLKTLNMEDKDLADIVGTSVETIKRWKRNQNHPYVKIRFGVVSKLIDLVNR